uniref:N-acetyltransferase domain-containing protein n=1 Tax=Bursaphelenchus xylophilus TaxID=6326 RepID=A0A1I7SGM1_BURXY
MPPPRTGLSADEKIFFLLNVDEVTKDLGIPDGPERIWTGLIQYTTDVAPHFLQKHKKYVVAHDELLSVNKDYNGNGLAKILMAEGIKELARDRICDYYFGNPTHHGTTIAGARVGAPQRWKLPFQDIMIHGRSPMKPEAGNVGIGAIGVHIEPIDKLMKIIEKMTKAKKL